MESKVREINLIIDQEIPGFITIYSKLNFIKSMQQADPYRSLSKAHRTAYLIAQFLRKELTIAEEEELDTWVGKSETNQELLARITGETDWEHYLAWFNEQEVENRLQATREKLGLGQSYPGLSSQRRRLLKYAAGIFLLVTAAVIFYYLTPAGNNKPAAHTTADISPGAIQAILRMDDRVSVILSARDTVITEGCLVKEGILTYTPGISVWHELEVPRKGFFRVNLPDQTKVWLNAASVLRYPSSFADTTRVVQLSGEGFFEIASDPGRPFIVEARGVSIRALGTAFNVNAYPDEASLVTTLINGSVRVSDTRQQRVLQAGTQLIDIHGNWRTNAVVDTSRITAWKNNTFQFSNTDIRTAMRMLSRWYGVEIVFAQELQVHLNGTISRDVPLSRVLELFENTGQVHFRINNNTVTVMK